MIIVFYCWIEFEQGWYIDFWFRQWLGDEDDFFNGVFQLFNYL